MLDPRQMPSNIVFEEIISCKKRLTIKKGWRLFIFLSVQEEATSEITPEERAAKAAEVQRKIAERKRIVEEKDKQDAIMREKIRLSILAY